MTQTAVEPIKTRSFLPEELQNVLLYWRDKFKQGYFEVGDIAARCIEAMNLVESELTQQEIFNEIGRFCGKSGRTVRYYYETAIFFDQGLRDHFSDLPFSHFVFARQMGERWREVLIYAQERPSISEDALRAHFIADSVRVAVDDSAIESGDVIPVSYVVYAYDTKPNPRNLILSGVDGFKQGVHAFSDLLEAISVEGQPVRELIQEDIAKIRHLIDEIENTMPSIEKILEKM